LLDHWPSALPGGRWVWAHITKHLFKGQYLNQLLQALQSIGNDDAFFGKIGTTLTEPTKPVGPAMALMVVLMDENANFDPQSDIPSFRTRNHTSLLDHWLRALLGPWDRASISMHLFKVSITASSLATIMMNKWAMLLNTWKFNSFLVVFDENARQSSRLTLNPFLLLLLLANQTSGIETAADQSEFQVEARFQAQSHIRIQPLR
jgi:hypothetical protein